MSTRKLLAAGSTLLIALRLLAGPGGGTADSFTVVTLSSGQVLYGQIGCEVMLRVGSASCVSARWDTIRSGASCVG